MQNPPPFVLDLFWKTVSHPRIVQNISRLVVNKSTEEVNWKGVMSVLF